MNLITSIIHLSPQQSKLNKNMNFSTPEERHHFYNSKIWRRLRISILNDNPLCTECLKQNKLIPATDIDHIIPLQKAPDRCVDRTNLDPLCHSCHSSKTGQENKNKFSNKKMKLSNPKFEYQNPYFKK